jgi:hypothetical protein
MKKRDEQHKLPIESVLTTRIRDDRRHGDKHLGSEVVERKDEDEEGVDIH